MILLMLIDQINSHIHNKKKPKDEYGKSWAISYYAVGPKDDKQIGLLFVQAENRELAEAKASIEVSMRTPGLTVKNVIAAEAGIAIRKNLSPNPPWKDLTESEYSHNNKS